VKVKTLLNKPEKWIKGYFSNGGRYCLVGALMECYGTPRQVEFKEAATKVRTAINELSKLRKVKLAKKPNIIRFNDNPKTTFKDIRAVLKLANV